MSTDPFLQKKAASVQQSPQATQQQVHTTQSSVGVMQKKGSKVSMKTFLLGCVIFLLLFVGLGAGVLFLIIQNPDQFASVGLDRSTIQRLLQVFTLLFFGFLFFAGFGLMLVNAYRFTTIKNKPRFKYAIGSFVWVFVLLLSIAGGAVTLRYVQALNLERDVDTSSLVIPYVVMKTGPVSLLRNPQPSLIAPISLAYELNTNAFNRQIFPTLGAVDIQSMELDCGVGDQVLSLNMQTAVFVWDCYYSDKGTYEAILRVTTINRQTSELATNEFSIGAISIPTAILISSDEEVRYTNSEVNVGRVPSKVTFDARDVFTDLGLRDYVISWDFNDDGVVDREWDAVLSYLYDIPKVYTVAVRFPELDEYIYSFPLRVEQSDVPVCRVNIRMMQGTQYQFQVEFVDRVVPISSYGFSILDVSAGNTVITKLTESVNTSSYTFPGAGTYSVKVDFVSVDGKQGSCESDNFIVWSADFSIDYTLQFKTASQTSFATVSESSDVFRRGNSIVVTELPTILQLSIVDILPRTPDTEIKVFLNDVAILSFDQQRYEMRIDQDGSNEIRIEVVDVVRGTQTTISIPIEIEQEPIVGKFVVTPDTVWIEPFAVKFDVSTTILDDPEDSIVFFTWNFGDGEVKTNTSQAIVSHTYRYNYTNEQGRFSPTVTVMTAKGRSLTFGPDNDIIVRKAPQSLTIMIDSHPAQIAKVGDSVEFSLDIGGLPERIFWDFGDGNTLECEGRQCVNTDHIYVDPGTYNVMVTIEYDSEPSVSGKIGLKVNS